jgi:tetratricopeptide (TPR) repeat protein
MNIDARVPNNALRALLTECAWSGGDLARAVNAVAAESGLRLSYGRASAAQWLAGGCPRPPVPELVAEALSRRLGRTVTVSGAGFPPGTGRPAKAGTLPARLVRLAGEPAKRVPSRLDVYRLALLTVPGFPEAAAAPGTGTVSRAELDAARAALKVFSDADGTLGGGAVRVPVAGYLANTVSPWLHAGATSPEVHRELLQVAAELTYLCGFLCFDDNLHGVAQRYYRIALQLAAEAEDEFRYAITLRAMSVQARSLGHHAEALRLAEAATGTVGTRAAPQTRAFLHGQLAVAAAATGDRRRASAGLATAEHELARAEGEVGAVGAYHFGSFAHQRAAVAACLDNRPGAIRAMRESLRNRPRNEYRARAVTLARLAELQAAHGGVEEAVGSWHRFLDLYPAVHSARLDAAVRTLRQSLRPHRNLPAARELLHRVAGLAPRTLAA